MKIHIIGAPGSGKTTLARELSQEQNIPRCDLDDLQWDNTGDYGTKRDPAERDRLLRQILLQESWIIEGVYYEWCGQCFADADVIYLLSVPQRTCRRRIIRRFIRRKLHLEHRKKESLSSLKKLLRWADKYQTKNMVEIRKILAQYPEKVIEYKG